MSAVQTVKVVADDADLRLDRWFRRHFPSLTHGRLEKLLRTGQVRVDGGRVKSSTRLAEGQRIRVPPLGDVPATRPKRSRTAPDPNDVKDIRARVIHMDDYVLAINKPPGLPVQGGSGVTRHLDAMLDGLKFDAYDRPRLVHRLDKDTSGVLLLGRTARAAAALAQGFRSREAEKTYWAIVVGVPDIAQGRIDQDIAKRAVDGDGSERVVADDEAGKRAVTYYSVIETAGRKAAWVALRPETGRTHQIRAHCWVLGNPILGDGKYGGADAFIDGIPGGRRLHLHARSIEIPHPDSGTLSVNADLPPDLVNTWRFFGFDQGAGFDPFAGLET